MSAANPIKAFAQVNAPEDGKKAGGASLTGVTVLLVAQLDGAVNAAMLEAAMDVGDYQGMDVAAIGVKIDYHIKNNAKELMTAVAWGVKNSGVFDPATLDKFSGTEALRNVQAKLQLYTKTRKIKSPAPPKDALTISRILTFLHPIAIGMINKWKLPAAAGVEFPLDSSVFKSAMGPYMYHKDADKNNYVYMLLLEWNCAHHDQVNPDTNADGTPRVKPKFNKSIFDLKIRTSAIANDQRIAWTAARFNEATAKKLGVGATFPDQFVRNGYKMAASDKVA